jgi:hypothetical protein
VLQQIRPRTWNPDAGIDTDTFVRDQHLQPMHGL